MALPTIKLILTDMDGTIVLPAQHEVSIAVREAVIAAEKAGVAVVPVTGRPFEMAQGVMNVLGFDGLCVVDGGATIREVTSGRIVWSEWLQPDTLKPVVKALLPYSEFFIDYFPEQKELDVGLADPDAITEAAPYVFTGVKNENIEAAEAALADIPGIVVHTNPSFEGRSEYASVQVTHRAADKYHGVQNLLRLNGVSKEHVMAIGDGNNDLPLFESASLKIAVGNATEKLKATADYVVADVTEDGFAEAVAQFVLPGEGATAF
jgi:HAD superfamily hydrolase (TIGR01484 family)